MNLPALKAAVPGLGGKAHNDKIKIFGWWLHTHDNKPTFSGSDILKCYDKLDFARPSAIGPYISPLVEKKELLKSSAGYRLAHQVREEFDAALGKAPATVVVNKQITTLGAQLPDMAERAYFQEMLICHDHNARRAAVVMTWNVAYSHLCDHVLTKRLADFNARWQVTYPGMHKKKVLAIASVDDINDQLKESEFLTVCRDADIITTNVFNTMDGALKKRNAAAHPSTAVIDQLQTDAYISDLINNAVLKIK
jgi:hypothetical protein